MIGDKKYSFEQLGLHSQIIEDVTGSTAQHIHDGMFIIYDPENRQAKVLREEIPALAIVPAILRNFNLSVLHYMGNTGPYPN
jgi:hypothetical protein